MRKSLSGHARPTVIGRHPLELDPLRLTNSVIAPPLLELITNEVSKAGTTPAVDMAEDKEAPAAAPAEKFAVIIDLNLNFRPPHAPPGKVGAGPNTKPTEAAHPDPRRAARLLIEKYIRAARRRAGMPDDADVVDTYKTNLNNQYVFARLEGSIIKDLVRRDQRGAESMVKQAVRVKAAFVQQAAGRDDAAVQKAIAEVATPLPVQFRTIHHIWPDFKVRNCITASVRTVKVDAAQSSFTAHGEGICWAVMDTGIDALHPHFALHKNIDVASSYHADFTGGAAGPQPLADAFGHGTHVAGIIAGQQSVAAGSNAASMVALWRELDENGHPVTRTRPLDAITGMAPKCKLVSLKVLDEFGMGLASSVIAAIAHVQLINGNGRDLKIHGVNLSLGHTFDPKWFACGHSPLCVEVNRLVKSGVVVVVAAGNTGYGTLRTSEGDSEAALDLTINDPGNAEYAITVGSTHRDMPHRYGVSYFSSKGPTGDGRMKPDLIAPGEKIISCAAKGSSLVEKATEGEDCAYFENSGTSMAAPHVSGAIAAFLSIRREFIGEAERVKKIFVSTATDMGRDRYFQGAGLVDLMRAIQSV